MILLELLCEVKRICELADIEYVMIAGTMLGAVRHGGFIPWDDDADVAMLRNEYETFRMACGTETLPYEQGIWIDIFPLDYVPNSRIGRKLCNFHCFCIRKLLYSESGKYREKHFIKRMTYTGLSKISLERILAHYEKYIRRRNDKRTDWVRILMFPTPTMNMVIFKNGIDLQQKLYLKEMYSKE